MLAVVLFLLAVICSIATMAHKKVWHCPRSAEIVLGYIFFFNVGIMGLLAAYAHVFMADEIARKIGWQPGSPFQFEIAMANLSYGVLGILAFWVRGRFWDATGIGWSILLLGCFVGHLHEYFAHHDTAPLNIGVFIWFNDLFLPVLVLLTLLYLHFPTDIAPKKHPNEQKQ